MLLQNSLAWQGLEWFGAVPTHSSTSTPQFSPVNPVPVQSHCAVLSVPPTTHVPYTQPGHRAEHVAPLRLSVEPKAVAVNPGRHVPQLQAFKENHGMYQINMDLLRTYCIMFTIICDCI